MGAVEEIGQPELGEVSRIGRQREGGMVTVQELQRVEHLLEAMDAVADELAGELERAKQRKLTTVGGAWDERVEALSRAHALLAEAKRRVESAWS